MTTVDAIQESIHKEIEVYCQQKGYQLAIVSDPKDPNKLRIDISNLADRTIINIYSTGTISVQGKQNQLREEMEELKSRLENRPASSLIGSTPELKACSATYDIMIIDIRDRIKASWTQIAPHCDTTNSPSQYISYRSKLSKGKSNITITQFTNGRLMLQGKSDYFLDNCCDNIEKIAQPSNKDVAARFVSTDQTALDVFVSRSTPDLIQFAEDEVIKNLKVSYNFLDLHDKNWFIASKCLCLSEVVLPEYSAFVMPSSKAFEGFCKKLLIAIGLLPPNHFTSKGANFSMLSNKKDPTHVTICAKEKHVETYLEKLRVSLDQYRNFMMHSDSSFVTKVETPDKAISLVNDIYKIEEELFSYFSTVFRL